MRYRVFLLKTISLVTEVEADDEESAMLAAINKDPGLCHQCTGYGKDTEVNADAEWLTFEDFYEDAYEPDKHGVSIEVLP
jgi:hypothetical protein